MAVMEPLASTRWDRLAYHRLLPLAESVASAHGIAVELLVFGRGIRSLVGREALVKAMVRRAGWPLEEAREVRQHGLHGAEGGAPAGPHLHPDHAGSGTLEQVVRGPPLG